MTADENFAYTTNSYNNTVSVIDTHDNTIKTIIPVGINPTDIAITPDGASAYVSNMSDNTVSFIDTRNNTVKATIPVKGFPSRIFIK
ncbi:YncE family protein [Bacillus cereus]